MERTTSGRRAVGNLAVVGASAAAGIALGAAGALVALKAVFAWEREKSRQEQEKAVAERRRNDMGTLDAMLPGSEGGYIAPFHVYVEEDGTLFAGGRDAMRGAGVFVYDNFRKARNVASCCIGDGSAPEPVLMNGLVVAATPTTTGGEPV